MSRVDVHPEDLLDAAHAGAIDAQGAARLAAHARSCSACALEGALIGDFASETAARAGDGALIERLALAAAGPKRRGRTMYALAAALAVGAFGGAALAMLAMRTPEVPARRVVPHERVETPVIEPIAREAPRVEPEVPVPAPAIEAPEPEPPSPGEMLAQANAARREGERASAVRLYRRLQSVHPRSTEAAISRVTLGRLLLDGADDPAGALREFDRYLAQSRHRVLEEEARVGRALSLQRLGRRDEERRAWRDLLDHHPDTLYAERARARL